MNTIAIDPARMTENIDMSTPDTERESRSGPSARWSSRSGCWPACPGPRRRRPAFARATSISATTPPTATPWYDNAQPPVYGCFTDVLHSGWRPSNMTTVTFRPPEINIYQNMNSTTANPPNPAGTNPWGDSPDKPWPCGLNFYGDSLLTSNGHAEMWITIVQPPGKTHPHDQQAGASRRRSGTTM